MLISMVTSNTIYFQTLSLCLDPSSNQHNGIPFFIEYLCAHFHLECRESKYYA